LYAPFLLNPGFFSPWYPESKDASNARKGINAHGWGKVRETHIFFRIRRLFIPGSVTSLENRGEGKDEYRVYKTDTFMKKEAYQVQDAYNIIR